MPPSLPLRLAAVALLTAATAQTVPTVPQDVRASVAQVLQTQQDAWNRHDLDAFMEGYWKSPELTFFSGAQRTSGWQGALDRYRKV